MKKLISALFAIAIPLSLVQAQTLSSTGTYTGEVKARCFATSNTFAGELTPESVSGDNFVDTMTGRGSFNYRSNTPACRITSIDTRVTQAPDGENGNVLTDSSSCVADKSVGADLGIATSTSGSTINVTGTLEDDSDNVLIAGTYKLECRVNLTYPM